MALAESGSSIRDFPRSDFNNADFIPPGNNRTGIKVKRMKHSPGRNRIKALFVIISLMGLFCISPTRSEQAYTLRIWTVAAGGGTSEGGNYTLNGSIGQPGAGTKKGATYTLLGGFWGSEMESEEISSTEVLEHILGVKVLTGEKLALADANTDGKVNIADVITLVNQGR